MDILEYTSLVLVQKRKRLKLVQLIVLEIKDTKFCGVCGSPIAHNKRMDRLCWDDLFDTVIKRLPEDDLATLKRNLYKFYMDGAEEGDNEYLIPTTTKVFGFNFNSDEGVYDVDMSNGAISPELATELLKEDISILQKFYKNVEVKFGYLSRFI